MHLDPSDPNARRGVWGGVLTLDGLDPEVVTAPEPLRLGCVDRVHDGLAHGRAALESDLRAAGLDVELTGYSTHVSVEVPDERVVAVARHVLDRHSPALMLAFDRADSPGLLVRPRPGRLEICGEFTAGRQLRTAAALSLGVGLLADRSVRRPWTGRSAARVRGHLAPAVERFSVSGFSQSARAKSVLINPGAMQFARMPCCPYSTARLRASCMSAALEMQ